MSFAPPRPPGEGCPICQIEQESTDKKVLLNAGWVETNTNKFVCFDCADDITTKKFQVSPAFFKKMFDEIRRDLITIKDCVSKESYTEITHDAKYRQIIRSSCVDCGQKGCKDFYINCVGKPQCCVCHDDIDNDHSCRHCKTVIGRKGAVASKPEPPPKTEGTQVTPSLLSWLDCVADCIDKNILESTADLILARDKYGFNKYGQHLMTGDGRDTQEDALQEFGDLLQYIHKAKMNGEDIEKLKKLLPVLALITEHPVI